MHAKVLFDHHSVTQMEGGCVKMKSHFMLRRPAATIVKLDIPCAHTKLLFHQDADSTEGSHWQRTQFQSRPSVFEPEPKYFSRLATQTLSSDDQQIAQIFVNRCSCYGFGQGWTGQPRLFFVVVNLDRVDNYVVRISSSYHHHFGLIFSYKNNSLVGLPFPDKRRIALRNLVYVPQVWLFFICVSSIIHIPQVGSFFILLELCARVGIGNSAKLSTTSLLK